MYQKFSMIYDRVMCETPYDEWFEKLYALLRRQGKDGGHLCELGCGTGEMTGRFADAGYEVTGIDLSPDMLAQAVDKKRAGQEILYVNQDMVHFSLHKRADVVLCICDSINYLLEEEELLQTFQCVRDNLAEDGLFVFDMKTEYCYSDILGDMVRVEDEDGYTVIWENCYNRDNKINEYMLTMFLYQEDVRLYERYDERHCQRAYTREEIGSLLSRAGLVPQACYGADMGREPGEREERIYFVANVQSRI